MHIDLPGLQNLEKKDIGKAVKTLTSAFSNDPCLKYLLNSEEYDYKKASFIHRYSINLGLRYGIALCTSKEVEGICIWMPPRSTNTTTWMFLRAGGLSLRNTVDKGIIKRLQDYGNYSGSIHHKNAPFPHWYLLSIAVEKEYQGKGISNRLMKPVMDYFDKNNQSCYLETHNSKNVSYYQKFGFEVAEIGCLPGTKKTHWGMVRKSH